MHSITSKWNSTFETIVKATADKMTAKVVVKLKLSLQREELIAKRASDVMTQTKLRQTNQNDGRFS